MPRHCYCFCIVCAVVAALAAWLVLGPVPSASAEPAAGKPVSFIADVAPILKESCFACHDARKKAGKYDMTTVEKLFAGGSNGEPITAGKPDESEFYTLVVTHDDRRMPPADKGEPISKEKAAVIERWVREGAIIDHGLDPKVDLVRELRGRWVPPAPPEKYPFPVAVSALAFAPDGKTLVVGGNHELTVWSVPDGKLVRRVRTRAERTYSLAFLYDGTCAAAGGRPGQEGDVRVYDLSAAGRTVDGVTVLDGVSDPAVMRTRLLDADDSVLCLAVSADGKQLAAAGTDRVVRVWNLSDGVVTAKLSQTFESHTDWVLALSFSADGRYLASAGRDKTAKVWDLKAKESVTTFPDHQGTVSGVTFGKDGTTCYSVGSDKKLRAWKPAGDGKQLKAAGGHTDEVFQITVSPKDAVLATASADRTVRLWDAEKLSPVRTLTGMNDFVYSVAFSPDGTTIAAGGYDSDVRIWNVASGKQIGAFNASPGHAASTFSSSAVK